MKRDWGGAGAGWGRQWQPGATDMREGDGNCFREARVTFSTLSTQPDIPQDQLRYSVLQPATGAGE